MFLSLADWRIPDPDWHDIAAELRRRARARADYGQRKRNTASALIWIQATQGEHLFAAHRQSPTEYLPGSVQDWALSIDRAWWRTHHDQPGRHYPDLYAICTDIAEHLAQQIDHTGGATAATQLGRASRTGTKGRSTESNGRVVGHGIVARQAVPAQADDRALDHVRRHGELTPEAGRGNALTDAENADA